ncbi:MAG: hypothetical protein RBT63_07330 [Bdellovibrionales bacterium]|nr:hypothetical protein [Bdellovibrionales bacterium]
MFKKNQIETSQEEGQKVGMVKRGLKQGLKSLAILAMGTSIMASTVGCTSEEVAAFGGALAVVAGVVAIDAALDRDRDRDHRRCQGDWVCVSRTDHRGRSHRDCREKVWDSCARRLTVAGLDIAADSALGQSLAQSIPQTDLAVQNIAAKYSLPLESAERFTAVLQDAAAGQVGALDSLGLSELELKRVARYKMPSDVALDQVGVTLALSREMARDLVQQLLNETRIQMADVNSAAWTACQSTGKWKTDANGGTCKSLSWSGCSPETGATMCASAR